jgi:hypothetical protein
MSFPYITDIEISNDGGRTWNKQPLELTLSRKE